MAKDSILIVGAGIGGLTAAISLARSGRSVHILEQAARLEEAGAGLQLTPNAARVLIDLGLRERLERTAVSPQRLRIRAGRSGRELAVLELGPDMERQYGAPWWVIHRADLQAALLDSVAAQHNISLELDRRVEDFAAHPNGVSVLASRAGVSENREAAGLIGADGLWSVIRAGMGEPEAPSFRSRTAFRAVIPYDDAPAAFRRNESGLWIGPEAHIVHYPVHAGREINVVAILTDDWREPGWSAEADRNDLMRRVAQWAPELRNLLATPPRWLKWALCDRAPISHWGEGPVTLLGDAAHPMVPFLAQGAAMAIEDAAVLTREILARPGDIPGAMRQYERQRMPRTARVQREARENGNVYHLPGLFAHARDLAIKAMGGERLRQRYDWIYNWRLSA